jgi:hypothetical protein
VRRVREWEAAAAPGRAADARGLGSVVADAPEGGLRRCLERPTAAAAAPGAGDGRARGGQSRSRRA